MTKFLHVGLYVSGDKWDKPGSRRQSGCVDDGEKPMLEPGQLIYWVGKDDFVHCVDIKKVYQSWNSSYGTSWCYMGEYMLDNTVAGSGDLVYVFI